MNNSQFYNYVLLRVLVNKARTRDKGVAKIFQYGLFKYTVRLIKYHAKIIPRSANYVFALL